MGSLNEPILDVNVATAYERGLLGIAVTENIMKLHKEIPPMYIFITPSLSKMLMMFAQIPVLATRTVSL